MSPDANNSPTSHSAQTMDSVVQTCTHQSTAASTTVRVVRYPGADI